MIASAAGMGRRTFFRYFPSKEDLILEKYTLTGEKLRQHLRARPDDEPLSEALCAMFKAAAASDSGEAHAIEKIMMETPSLRGGYLYRPEAIQQLLVADARERAKAAGAAYADDDPTPDVLVGAAFAAVTAARAMATATASPRAWKDLLDAALGAIAPSVRG